MTSIVADIGGTNARFAIAKPVAGGYQLESLSVVDCRRFDGFNAALRHWLDGLEQPHPQQVCIAAAGPLEQDGQGSRVYMTNLGWTITTESLQEEFGFPRLELINDFAALALSLPRLTGEDYRVLRDKPRVPGAAMVVLGPGTGLGVAGLGVDNGHYHVLAGEGGHANLGVSTERELQLLQQLMKQQQPVFNEWVLSGSGLVHLYRAVCDLHGRKAEELTPPDISARGLDGSDPLCRETLLDFLNFLGSAAGDAALYLGARGGVFLGGGILPRIAELLPESQFEQRFLSKGRVERWMETVPVYALNAGYQALIGAAAHLED
ncbi:glucokinase [Microbulbifer thermotolerans]|uniref:glucokinase n=1 Tax=Microbulbifer thermotolerans TaxID=252514 RepID=UPI002248B584|nr:glucokinase [Microbulbifer thermotolerans]MCX2783713.1 glucokinase [Microbulbifer thermotolerans]MCX2795365.1 glucokinase [Microbulbifer thermotolerans]MCX2832362.1 glucokinase [Microbulbifer thermotolerans]